MKRSSLAQAFALAGSVLLFSYLIAVLTSILPLRLFDPAWQLNFNANVVDNGGIALIGLLVLLVACHLDHRQPLLRSMGLQVSRLSLLAAIGFLLVPPLQGWASVRLQEQLRSERIGKVERAARVLQELSRRIAMAPGAARIDEELRRFQGTGLTPQQRRMPLPQLRSGLLQQIEIARLELVRRVPPSRALQPGPLIATSLRIGLTALAYAIAFAALGRRPRAHYPVLEEVQGWLGARRDAMAEKRRARAAFLKDLADTRMQQQVMAAEDAAQATQRAHQLPALEGSAAPADSPSIPALPAAPKGGIDADYFEELSRGFEPDHQAIPQPPSGQQDPSPDNS